MPHSQAFGARPELDPQAHRVQARGDGAGGMRIDLPLTISAVQDGIYWEVWVRNLALGISFDFAVAAASEQEALDAAEQALRNSAITVTRVEGGDVS